MSVLADILTSTKERVAQAKAERPLSEMLIGPGETVRRSLRTALKAPGISLIAEIKGSSPSKGKIRDQFDPVEVALTYQANGARAISVLTEPKFFGGSLERLATVRDAVDIPVLRKDFVIDPYQLHESVYYGADAVLLIVDAVPDDNVKRLIEQAHSLGLEVLLEGTDLNQLERAAATGADCLGVNNRDLHSLEIDTAKSLEIGTHIKGKGLLKGRPLVAESGVETRDYVTALEHAGFDGILVGTALMASGNIGAKVRDLLGSDNKESK